MNVFVSHSVKDTAIVEELKANLEPHGIIVLWWRDSIAVGADLPESIYGLISKSRLLIAILNDVSLSRASTVGMELGYARGKSIPILPLVHKALSKTDLGLLQGAKYVGYDEDDVQESIKAITDSVLKVMHEDMRNELEAERRRNDALAILIIGGIIIAILAGSSK